MVVPVFLNMDVNFEIKIDYLSCRQKVNEQTTLKFFSDPNTDAFGSGYNVQKCSIT